MKPTGQTTSEGAMERGGAKPNNRTNLNSYDESNKKATRRVKFHNKVHVCNLGNCQEEERRNRRRGTGDNQDDRSSAGRKDGHQGTYLRTRGRDRRLASRQLRAGRWRNKRREGQQRSTSRQRQVSMLEWVSGDQRESECSGGGRGRSRPSEADIRAKSEEEVQES